MRPLMTDLTAVLSAALVLALIGAVYFGAETAMRAGDIAPLSPFANILFAVGCGLAAFVAASLTRRRVHRHLRKADRQRHG